MSTELDEALAAAIKDPSCPVQFSPMLMEVKRTLRKLRADLATHGNDTVATENRIIDAEFRAQELRTMLTEARAAIASLDPAALGGYHGNHPEEQEWYFRDELLSRIDGVLTPGQPIKTFTHRRG